MSTSKKESGTTGQTTKKSGKGSEPRGHLRGVRVHDHQTGPRGAGAGGCSTVRRDAKAFQLGGRTEDRSSGRAVGGLR